MSIYFWKRWAKLASPKKIRKKGSIRFFETPSGNHVIALPTCTVPLEHLIEENWHRPVQVGVTRKVLKVGKLRNTKPIREENGIETRLFVKSPETIFRSDGQGWWTNENYSKTALVSVDPRDLRVAKQATWEARILLQLLGQNFPAEVPQAIIIKKDGSRQVITMEVPGEHPRYFNAYSPDDAKGRLRGLGFVPRDVGEHNVIRKDGTNVHIDVNRWEFPPLTDVYKKRLVQAIKEQIEREKAK